MKIASLVLRVRPEHIAALTESLCRIPGIEAHGASADLGRLIVTIEDGPGYSMADSLLAASQAKHVLGTTLAYEYTDEGLEIEDETPGLPPLRQADAAGALDREV